jgi:hypothetical protein
MESQLRQQVTDLATQYGRYGYRGLYSRECIYEKTFMLLITGVIIALNA